MTKKKEPYSMNRALFGENVKCQHIEDKSQIRKISGKNSNFLASDSFFDAQNKLLKNNLAYEHITLFLQDSFTVIHKANGLLECRCNLKEYFKPTNLNYTIEGSSYASDIISC